jgi:hypothetical protein
MYAKITDTLPYSALEANQHKAEQRKTEHPRHTVESVDGRLFKSFLYNPKWYVLLYLENKITNSFSLI